MFRPADASVSPRKAALPTSCRQHAPISHSPIRRGYGRRACQHTLAIILPSTEATRILYCSRYVKRLCHGHEEAIRMLVLVPASQIYLRAMHNRGR